MSSSRSQSVAALHSELFIRFEAMLTLLDTCCVQILSDEKLLAWVLLTEEESESMVSMRNKAVRLYSSIWYEDDRDGRETITCPGIVGASPETLAAANACNIAKDAFKMAVLDLKALGRLEANLIIADLQHRQEFVATAMRSIGAARLNLKQAYRHIPILEKRPLKIGFTWSKNGRVIQRMNRTTVKRLLEQRVETPQTRLELQLLSELHDSEALARIRSICPHLRANIVFSGCNNDVNGTIQRRLMQTPLPILVPLLPGEMLPEFVPITTEPQIRPRMRRADIKIEDKPFLPSVRVHRYRVPYRFS